MTFEEARNLSPEQLSSMSSEERDQVISVLEQRNQDLQGEIDHTRAQNLKGSQMQDVENSNRAKAALGGLSQAPFGVGDELASVAMATKDTIEATADAVDKQGMAGFNNILSTYKQSYNHHHNAINEELKQLEKDHPVIFNAADIAGTMGIGMLTGGSTLYSKAGASMIGRLSLIAGEGFLHGVGRSNAETLGGRLEGGKEGFKTGAMFGAGGAVAGKVASKAAEKVGGKVGADRLVSFLSDSYKNFSKKVRGDTQEFAERMVNYTDKNGKSVLNVLHNAQDAQMSLRNAQKETYERLSNIYGEVDANNLVKVDGNYVYKRLINKIVDPIVDFGDNQIGSRKLKSLQTRLKKRIDQDFLVPSPSNVKIKQSDGTEQILMTPMEANVSLLNRLKNDYFDEVKRVTTRSNDSSAKLAESQYLEKAAYELYDMVDEHMAQAGVKLTSKGGDDIYKMWKNESTKYRDLKAGAKLMQDKIDNNKGKGFVRRVFLDHWGKMSLGAGAAMSVFGVPFGAVVATAGAVNMIASNPRINKATAMGLNKMSAAIKNNPDRYSKLASRLAVAAEVSDNAFYERLLEAGAEVDLMEAPLQRTMDDIVARQDSLMTMVDIHDPDISPMLRKAIAEGDSKNTGMLLTTSDVLSPYIAPGLGWEGKALSNKDKAAVGEYIKKLKPRERREATLQFKKDNKIPLKMLTGEEPKSAEANVLYQKAKDKIRNPEY